MAIENDEELEALDQQGRPIEYEDRTMGFKRLSRRASEVLYTLALTELRGNPDGLSRRSIRKILQNVNHPLAGNWKWLFDPKVKYERISKASVRNAIQDIRENYPFIVLGDGEFYPKYDDEGQGGRDPDISKLNDGAILKSPCQAHVMYLLSKVLRGNPVYDNLRQHIKEKHCSHRVSKTLQKAGLPQPEPHSLSTDIEFLVRAKYLKLSIQKGNTFLEVPYQESLQLERTMILQVAQRAKWEAAYIENLAAHYTI